jgi:multidrug efflux pump subunit AcrA (membrane-fusion protein)
LAGVVVAIFGLSAFSTPEVDVDAEPEAIPVVARPAQPQRLAPEIHVFGRVENPNTTVLRAATLAYVSEVNVREGQSVMPVMCCCAWTIAMRISRYSVPRPH